MQPLGYRMEEMIFTLADQNFFFNEIEVNRLLLSLKWFKIKVGSNIIENNSAFDIYKTIVILLVSIGLYI